MRQVGYLPELYEDARLEKYKIVLQLRKPFSHFNLHPLANSLLLELQTGVFTNDKDPVKFMSRNSIILACACVGARACVYTEREFSL